MNKDLRTNDKPINDHTMGKEPIMNKAKLIIACDYSGTRFFIMLPDENKLLHQATDLETAKDSLNYLGYYDFEIETRVRFTY